MIGASRERGTVGGEVFHNVLNGGFDGVVYPVNPAAEVVQAVRAYPSVLDLPDPVDLAVLTVPADAVAAVARECAQREIPALVVISSGLLSAAFNVLISLPLRSTAMRSHMANTSLSR